MRSRRPATGGRVTQKARSNRGMTLVEIMVAGMLLLFALAGIVPFFLTGLSQASTVRFKSVANNIAREKMEEIRQLDYREIYTDANKADDPSLGTRTLESLFGSTAVVRDSAFDVDYVVNVTPYEAGYLKEVTVNVSWANPPAGAAAAMTTLVHQQFLGPRGSRLTLDPTQDDPLGTPFLLLNTSISTKARYYIARADWNLVFDGLDQATPVAKDVYMRLALFDDEGQTISLGDSAAGYKIDDTHLHYSRDADDLIDAVWFEYDFDAATIPDGYWELRAVAYNIYNEPGNIWRLRVRVEEGVPAGPTSFSATAQDDNQTVVLAWAGGPERDRARYVLERRLWSGTDWLDWITIADNLNPASASYTDEGNVGGAIDPWGDASNQHYYEYGLHAVDRTGSGQAGATSVCSVVLPPLTTTTTLVTTTTSTISTTTTSTTTIPATSTTYDIVNTTNDHYNVVIKDSSGTAVRSVLVKKGTTTITGLAAGNYQITATPVKNGSTRTASFGVPAQAGSVVMAISN